MLRNTSIDERKTVVSNNLCEKVKSNCYDYYRRLQNRLFRDGKQSHDYK